MLQRQQRSLYHHRAPGVHVYMCGAEEWRASPGGALEQVAERTRSRAQCTERWLAGHTCGIHEHEGELRYIGGQARRHATISNRGLGETAENKGGRTEKSRNAACRRNVTDAYGWISEWREHFCHPCAPTCAWRVNAVTPTADHRNAASKGRMSVQYGTHAAPRLPSQPPIGGS